MSKKFDFSVIEKAGLTQSEAAKLLQANRVTVNNWVRGRSNPHVMWHDRVNALLTLLKAAIRLKQLPGKLPPPNKNNSAERSKMIRATLRKVEQRVKAARKKRA